jgi:hypothetical protein
MSENDISDMIVYLVGALQEYVLLASPRLLVCLAGLILAIANRRRYPSATRRLFFGVMIEGINVTLSPMICWLVTFYFYRRRIEAIENTCVFLSSSIDALALGLVIAAVFSGRQGTAELARLSSPSLAEEPFRPHSSDVAIREGQLRS